MKRFYSIVLISVFLTYLLSQNMIIIVYLIDVQTYTELYCENTDKPEMECNGKCHLSKELAKGQQEKQDSERTQILSGVSLYYVEALSGIKKPVQPISKKENNFHYDFPQITWVTEPPSRPPISDFI